MTAITVTERRHWVGASEVAALFGASPHLTKFELWNIKAGTIPAHDLDGQERIEAGRHLEPAIAAWATERWNWPLKNVAEYTPHPSVPRMGCSLDFETLMREPVETKNVDSLVFRDAWQTEGETVLDAPAHFLLQVQHQLACRPGAARGFLVACVGGNRLYRLEIPRHERLIARIEREVGEFWRSIEENRPPEPDFSADGAVISQLYAKGDGAFLDLRDNARVPDICAEYLAAKEEEKAAKKRADTALAEIKALVGTASGASASGYFIKAADIGPATVPETTRRGYRRWTIKPGSM